MINANQSIEVIQQLYNPPPVRFKGLLADSITVESVSNDCVVLNLKISSFKVDPDVITNNTRSYIRKQFALWLKQNCLTRFSETIDSIIYYGTLYQFDIDDNKIIVTVKNT